MLTTTYKCNFTCIAVSIVISSPCHTCICNGLSWTDKTACIHDNVIKWKYFPRYWPFGRGIHRSLVDSLRKVQWRGTKMFSLICAWTDGWANRRYAGDLRRHRAHYDVNVYWKIHLDHIALPWSVSGIFSLCNQTQKTKLGVYRNVRYKWWLKLSY